MTKRIVFINRYYRPDHSATSQLLTDLTLNIQHRDIEIHVITSRMYYSEKKENLSGYEVLESVHVHRVWTTTFGRNKLIGRAIDYFSFYLTSFIKILVIAKKNDLLIAKTDPPLISVIAAVGAKIKRAKLVNWLQDVFPEIAKSLEVKAISYGLVYSFLKCIRNWSLKVADKNIVLDEAMKSKIADEIHSSNSLEVISNWVVGDVSAIDKSKNYLVEQWGLDEKFVVGYSGNLGRAHDYISILEAVNELKSYDDIIFLFIGGGSGYEYLKVKARDNELKNIIFQPYQNINILSYSLSVPDIHLVSLENKLEGLIVPSKFYGILAVSKPMIMIGDEYKGLGKLVRDHDIGNVVPCGNGKNLASKILFMKCSPCYMSDCVHNASKLHREKFRRSIAIERWNNLINKILEA